MSAADFRESSFDAPRGHPDRPTARRARDGVFVLLAVVIAVGVAVSSWLPGKEAAAASVRSDQVVLYLNRDFSGPTKAWALKPGQPFLAVPYTGDDFQPASASIKLGADVGVLLFERPFFSTIDETCDYRLGDAANPELWWRSDKAMFVPGPREHGSVEGNLRPQPIASLILYRRSSGPPPGALLLERRRYVNWDCPAPTKARGYKRLFVPVAAAPHRQGCFNLDAGLSYASSGAVSLDFSAASELLLIEPRDLAADYAGIDHRFTVSLHDAKDCAGSQAAFSEAESGTRRFDLKQFGLDRKARAVMLRYDRGAYDAMLPTAGQDTEATPAAVAEDAPEDEPEEPLREAPQEARAEVSEAPRDEAPEQPPEQAQEQILAETAEDASVATRAEAPAEIAEEAPAEPGGGGQVAALAAIEAAPAAEASPDPSPEASPKASPETSPETIPETSPEAIPEPAIEATTEAPPAAEDSGLAGTAEPAATGNLAPAGEAVATAEAPDAQAPAQLPEPEKEAARTEEPEAAAMESATIEAEAMEAESAEAESARSEEPEVETAPSAPSQVQISQSDTTQSDTTQSDTTESDTSGFLVLPEAEEEAVTVGQTFKYPLLQGYRLNACLYQQEGCGQEAASKWCEARGFGGGASSFEIDENIGSLFPTLALGDLQLCANFVCDGFKEITCLP